MTRLLHQPGLLCGLSPGAPLLQNTSLPTAMQHGATKLTYMTARIIY